MLALAVMSTAFTGLAIGTGFERRYGALKRLGATPLPRGALLGAKSLAVLIDRGAAGAAARRRSRWLLGWDPHGSWAAVAAAACSPARPRSARSALLMAGTLRAEATLAAANLVYLLFLVSGGIAVPLDRFPDGARPVLEALPAGALSEGLRVVLRDGGALPWWSVGVLACLGGRRRLPRGAHLPLGVSRPPVGWLPCSTAGVAGRRARPPYAGCSSARWSRTSRSWSPAARSG